MSAKTCTNKSPKKRCFIFTNEKGENLGIRKAYDEKKIINSVFAQFYPYMLDEDGEFKPRTLFVRECNKMFFSICSYVVTGVRLDEPVITESINPKTGQKTYTLHYYMIDIVQI